MHQLVPKLGELKQERDAMQQERDELQDEVPCLREQLRYEGHTSSEGQTGASVNMPEEDVQRTRAYTEPSGKKSFVSWKDEFSIIFELW